MTKKNVFNYKRVDTIEENRDNEHIKTIKHRYREMATLTNKQRFILTTLLTLAAVLLSTGLLVAFINMSINQGTCELFRVMLSTAIITVSLTTFFIIALDKYSIYNKHGFKHYRKN